MDVVLVMFKGEQRRNFPLKAGKSVLGRRQECELRIPTQDVSRKHCEIECADDEAIVRDLGSSNGTFINGKRVAEGQLSPGDKLTVGPITFVVQVDGKPANIEPDDAALPATDEAEDMAPIPADGENTDDILDLGDIDFDTVEDPTSAIEAMLEEDDDDDDVKV